MGEIPNWRRPQKVVLEPTKKSLKPIRTATDFEKVLQLIVGADFAHLFVRAILHSRKVGPPFW